MVQKGDTVVDATCGNGNDTLALVKLVIDDSFKGCVYGMDVQEDAIKNTSCLLDQSLDPGQVRLTLIWLLGFVLCLLVTISFPDCEIFTK